MGTKKTSGSKSKAPVAKPQLQNLAARPSFDDTIDDQLVDSSGVFRVTSAIAQAQVGHDDDNSPRFANESLVMRAQRDGLSDEGPTLDEEVVVDDEAAAVLKRERLATLAARHRAQQNPRRR